MEIAIPADSTKILEVPVPVCNEGASISVNGVDEGPWPQALPHSEVPKTSSFSDFAVWPSSGVSLNLMLDVRGTHCYRYHTIEYYQRPEAFAYVAGYDPGIGLTGHKVYALPGAPDYFFEAAPTSVNDNSGQISVLRRELTESSCSQ
ncbi:MAG: hypothetical protein WB627_20750 [Candidatus Acidiferrum sp.]